MLAREVAMRRVQSGPYSAEGVARGRAALTDQSALAQQAAMRNLQAQQARSGTFGGSGSMFNQALLQQHAASDLSNRLVDFDRIAHEGMGQSLGQLDSIASREDAQRAAFDELLANIFLQTERGPIDLSGLLEELPAKKGNTVI